MLCSVIYLGRCTAFYTPCILKHNRALFPAFYLHVAWVFHCHIVGNDGSPVVNGIRCKFQIPSQNAFLMSRSQIISVFAQRNARIEQFNPYVWIFSIWNSVEKLQCNRRRAVVADCNSV